MKYDKCRQQLRDRQKGLKCRELLKIMKELGFEVRDARSGGHKVYDHPHIADFHGGDFNCGHGQGVDVGPRYIGNILKVIDEFEEELRKYLDG